MNDNRERTPSEIIAKQLALVRDVDQARHEHEDPKYVRWYEENILMLLRAEGHDQTNVIEMLMRLNYQNVALNKQLHADLGTVIDNVTQLAMAVGALCTHVGIDVKINGTNVSSGNDTRN